MGQLFHETGSFDVSHSEATMVWKVLVVTYKVEKRLLIWPLAFSFCVVVVAAVTAGVLTHNVASGAELGSIAGVAVVLLWSYILWLLS